MVSQQHPKSVFECELSRSAQDENQTEITSGLASLPGVNVWVETEGHCWQGMEEISGRVGVGAPKRDPTKEEVHLHGRVYEGKIQEWDQGNEAKMWRILEGSQIREPSTRQLWYIEKPWVSIVCFNFQFTMKKSHWHMFPEQSINFPVHFRPLASRLRTRQDGISRSWLGVRLLKMVEWLWASC